MFFIYLFIYHSYIVLIKFCTLLGMHTFYSALQGIEVILCENPIYIGITILKEMPI